MDDFLMLHNVRTIDEKMKKLDRDLSVKSEIESERISNLETRVENLSLVSEALWEIVSNELKLEPGDLKSKVMSIMTERQNRKNEKIDCIECDRVISGNSKKCMYCGCDVQGRTGAPSFDF